jgi:hypothetical protein
VFGGGGEEVLVANGGDEGDDFDVMRQAEVLLGDGAGGNTAWGLILVVRAVYSVRILTYQWSHGHCCDHHRCWP